MILYTNGCSFTYGGGLECQHIDEQRLRSVWPHHLGNLLNADETINLAQGCGSNDRIVRTTFEWISNTPRELLDKTIAVIQWTDPSRYEFYLPNSRSNPFENDSSKWALCKNNCVILPNPECNDRDEVEYQLNLTNRYLSTYTHIQGAYKLLFQVEALSSIFKANNIRYMYWSNMYDIQNTPDNIKNQLLTHNWIPDHIRWQYTRIPNESHPSLEGHVQIAKYVFEYIKDYS